MPEEDVQLVRKSFNGAGLQRLAEVAEAYWDPDASTWRIRDGPEQVDTRAGRRSSGSFRPT